MYPSNKVKQPYASIEAYDEEAKKIRMQYEKVKLLEEANVAIAWGMPDRENIGYTNSELINIIRKLRNYITAQ